MDSFSQPGTRAEYHSCLFTAISLDAEWTRRSHLDGKSCPQAAIDAAFTAISSRCEKYKGRVVKNLEEQGMKLPTEPHKKTRWESMYRPLEYVPLGHDDALSMIIFDDFDPFVNVTGQCPTTVEELAAGYLPKLESLAVEWKGADVPYVERAKNAFGLPYQLFHRDTRSQLPLMVFSRFKVNGLGSLGMGSLHHVALMRALVRCIGFTLTKLEEAAEPGAPQEPLMKAFEIEREDVEPTRFLMVDLLGQEELGVVYFVSNWSVATAINSRLQSLKFEEVLAADASGRLREELLASEWFDTICRFYSDIRDNEQLCPVEGSTSTARENLLGKILHAHPLRWVRSTPAVRKEVFYEGIEGAATSPVRGWIDATTHLRLAPGHQTRAQHITQNVAKKKLGAEASIIGTVRGSGPVADDFTIHQLGASDLALPHSDLAPADPARLVPARHFLAHVYALMEAAGGGMCKVVAGRDGAADTATRERQSHGRHIVGATTFCGIPVPVLKGADDELLISPAYEKEKHVAVLELILPVLKRRMMLDPGPVLLPTANEAEARRELEEWNTRLEQTALPDDRGHGDLWGALATNNICTKARRYGLPMTLSRTLEFVYHNFTTLLANPLAFDSVLDLYDVFTCFHRVLTQELPRACGEDDAPLDKRRVDMIARLIDAVHRALGHRMYRLFPENSHRDMDIDFRGGLNALVYSADGVLKLGVGVLRHHLLWEAVEDRARVGVVTRIGFRQGISAIALRLGVESKARLGIVETDVPHLYHLPSYVDFLHEAFHLVYDAARNPDNENPQVVPMLPTVPRDSGDLTIDGRLAEIFANMLTVLFVCPDHPRLLAEHMVIQYATRNMSETDPEVLGNFIELTCLLHIVCESITHLQQRPSEIEEKALWWYCREDGEEALIQNFEINLNAKGFISFFFDLLPYFSTKLSGWVGESPQFKDQLNFQLDVIFDEIYVKLLEPFVPIVAAKVCLIFSRYWFRASGRLVDDGAYKKLIWQRAKSAESAEATTIVTRDELQKLSVSWTEIHQELQTQMQSIFDPEHPRYEPFSFLTWRHAKNEKGRLDPMIVLGVLLGEILRRRSEDMLGKDKTGPHHLPTLEGAACFDAFPVTAKSANSPKVFIQRGVSALFSSDLEHRARRLGSRITMLKMFGDMASRLRSKRLSEMLERNLSVAK